VAVAGGTPERGGTLRLPGRDPTALDPALARDVASAEYLYEIYSGLVTLTPDLQITPDLASHWTTSPDGTAYTFTLRSGARFHDGRPVTAEDVRYSLDRACDPATGSDVAATYLGDIVGCLQKMAGAQGRLAGASVSGDQVVLRIDAPKAYFLSKLAYPTAFVVDRALPPGPAAANGTGPFRLAAYEPETSLELERHDGYYGDPPWLDRVVFDLRPVVAGTLYENGELDASPVGIGDLERVRDPLNPLSLELVEGQGELGVTYLAFNLRRPPTDDADLRRAIQLAVDRDWLARVALKNAVRPLGTILPPGMPGYAAERAPAADPHAARAALEASRWTRSARPLVLSTPGDGGVDPVVAAVADSVSRTLGIRLVVEQSPWPQFQQELSAGVYDMWMLGWSADYPDPQDFLDVLFHSAAPLNSTGFADDAVDELLEQARTTVDLAERLALYGQAETRILAAAPWVPLYTGLDVWLVKPYVRGFMVPSITMPRLAAVWLAH
jgi:oligopeptide transport system substrate-binding protein